MKRFPLMAATAVFGIALLAGVTHELTAATKATAIPPSGGCYYAWYTCSYGDSSAYWTDCDPGYSPGMISTSTARAICRTYVES